MTTYAGGGHGLEKNMKKKKEKRVMKTHKVFQCVFFCVSRNKAQKPRNWSMPFLKSHDELSKEIAKEVKLQKLRID